MQSDIYVKPADANESQFESKNESTCTSNLICAHNWTSGLKTHRFTDYFLSNCVSVCTSENNLISEPFEKVLL